MISFLRNSTLETVFRFFPSNFRVLRGGKTLSIKNALRRLSCDLEPSLGVPGLRSEAAAFRVCVVKTTKLETFQARDLVEEVPWRLTFAVDVCKDVLMHAFPGKIV